MVHTIIKKIDRIKEENRMQIETQQKGPFIVIGKEGSTAEGEGFIQRIWPRRIPMEIWSGYGE